MAEAGGGVIHVQMGGRRRLVTMAVQAIDCCVIGVGNNHLHRSASWRQGIDVAAGIVAGAATIGVNRMLDQDIGKSANHMAVGTGLGIGLAAISRRVDLDRVIYCATHRTMVMAIEIGSVAGDALTAADNSRGHECAIASRVVAGGATLGGMGLAYANKG